MRHQKLMRHNNTRLTKSQTINNPYFLFYSIFQLYIYIYIYIYISLLLRNKHAHRKGIENEILTQRHKKV